MAPVIYGLSALALTWPLATQISTHLPLGTEPTETVPLLNLWTLGWNRKSLLQGYEGYWDAPIFFPARGAFAYSDPQPLTVVPSILFWESSPALAYNLTLICYLILNGYVAFKVLRSLDVDFPYAIAGGLLVQALPFTAHERGVLQLQPLFGPLWAIGAFWNLVERPSLGSGISFGLALGVTFLTSEYFALALLPSLALAAIFRLRKFKLRRSGGHFGLAAVVALAMILPVGIAQAGHLTEMGFGRGESSLARTSAELIDYLQPSSRLRISSYMPTLHDASTQQLYPGGVVALLALLGVMVGRAGDKRRSWVSFLALSSILAVSLSLGTNLRIGDFSPYGTLHSSIPFLGWTRSPFRFAALAQLGTGLLAAEGLIWIGRRSRIVLAATLALAFVELAPYPERLTPVPSIEATWSEHLDAAGSKVAVHLPWPQDRAASEFTDTAAWMLQSLPLDVKLINGYSGFFPRMNSQLRDLTEDFPSESGVRALRALGADVAVIHRPLGSRELSKVRELIQAGLIRSALITSDATVINLPVGEVRSIASFEGEWKLRANAQAGIVTVEAQPTILDVSVYTFAAGVTPLEWVFQVELGGQSKHIEARGQNALLLYGESGSWITFRSIAAGEAWRSINLLDQSTGAAIGTIDLSPEG